MRRGSTVPVRGGKWAVTILWLCAVQVMGSYPYQT